MKIFEKAKDFAPQKKISDNILKIFRKEDLNNLARETGFVQGSTGRIEGDDLVRLMKGIRRISERGVRNCDVDFSFPCCRRSEKFLFRTAPQ